MNPSKNQKKKNPPPTPKAKKPQIAVKRSVPAASGMSISSSATHFRTKNVRDPKRYPGAICVSGHEFLSSISTTGATTGSNLLTLALNPLSLTGTRLEKYGSLYEKFLFRKFVLHYTSADPSTATGQYILAYDRDFADETPSATTQGIREYFAMAGSRINNVYLNSSFPCPVEDRQDFYYTNDTGYEGRIVFQGQVYMAAVSGTTFHGSVWIEYELELYDPAIEPNAEFFPTLNTGPVTFAMEDPGALAYEIDLFQFLGTQLGIGPDSIKVRQSAFTTPDVFSGNKGLVIPPGQWLLEWRATGKTNGATGFAAAYNLFMYTFNKAASSSLNPAEGVALNTTNFITELEAYGYELNTVNLSTLFRVLIRIPVQVGMVWLFANNLPTAAINPVYASAFVSLLNADALAGSGASLLPFVKSYDRPSSMKDWSRARLAEQTERDVLVREEIASLVKPGEKSGLQVEQSIHPSSSKSPVSPASSYFKR